MQLLLVCKNLSVLVHIESTLPAFVNFLHVYKVTFKTYGINIMAFQSIFTIVFCNDTSFHFLTEGIRFISRTRVLTQLLERRKNIN